MVGGSMLKKFVNAIKEGTFFEKLFHKINVNYRKLVRKLIIRNVKIDPKKVIFITFQGKYTGSTYSNSDLSYPLRGPSQSYSPASEAGL